MKTIVASHNPDLTRELDRDLMRRRDLRLVSARSTAELLELLHDGGALCFLDRLLPDGDGRTALEAIRADRRLAQIPVVMVAPAGAPQQNLLIARSIGFDDVIALPTKPGELSLLVARLLGMPLREGERFALRLHVFDAPPSDEAIAPDNSYLGTSVDLSQAGILVRAKRQIPAGASLMLRFLLPGHPPEVTARARVVRVDPLTFAPDFGLALFFDRIADTQRLALRQYLSDLVLGRPFSWHVRTDGTHQQVSLYGTLRADSNLQALHGLQGEVDFWLRQFRRIGSDSIQCWIELVRHLDKATRIRLHECPTSFVHQANLIPNLLDRSEVVSLFAPYSCKRCGLDEEKLIDVERDLDGGRRRIPPAFLCSGCQGSLSFDELVDQYFAFLDERRIAT